MADDRRRIHLRVTNKTAFIWDVDGAVIDIALVRSQHRICGILSGTLPHVSQQNLFLGVPLALTPEEAVLLVENESAVLIDDPNAHPQPSLQHLKDWEAGQVEDIRNQISLVEAKEAQESAARGRAMTADALRKRQAREEKKAAQAKLAEESGEADTLGAMLAPEPSKEKEKAGKQPSAEDVFKAKAESVGYTVVIPASSSSHKWYNPDSSCVYSTIAAAKEAGIWSYPTTLQERARCGVFRSLWKQGYFMGSGIKFGGDYLVYPGDPLRYHSHFAASVLDSPVSSLRPMEIVAHGRLGTATKKAHLLCGWDDDKQEVSYLTIEWAGFG
ncbi:hypothetical protein H0H92_011497 [Tricholoma furcatifolium]|nr:hypothetical protein H0H92_011497 [Tricholoma furcatifolium]